jgi:hypothetical protein
MHIIQRDYIKQPLTAEEIRRTLEIAKEGEKKLKRLIALVERQKRRSPSVSDTRYKDLAPA